MGTRVTPELARLINERKIMKAQISEDMVSKELESSLVSRFEDGMALRQEADYGLNSQKRVL